MTLEEKVGQLSSFWLRDSSAFDDAGNFVGTADTALLNRGIGTFSGRSFRREGDNRRRARCINSLQKYLVEKTRLGIPAFIFSESLAWIDGTRSHQFSAGHCPGQHLGYYPGGTGISAPQHWKGGPGAPGRYFRRYLIWRGIRAGAAPRNATVRMPIWSRV